MVVEYGFGEVLGGFEACFDRASVAEMMMVIIHDVEGDLEPLKLPFSSKLLHSFQFKERNVEKCTLIICVIFFLVRYYIKT